MTCNSGILVGTIVTDITRKEVNSELTVVSFRVAPINSKEGDSPIPVVAYNQQAERLFTRSNKGDTMSFAFRLRYVTWMTEDEQPRGRMEVIVTSSDMIRLGQISTQIRAEEAAGALPKEDSSSSKPKKKVVSAAYRGVITEQTPDEIPF